MPLSGCVISGRTCVTMPFRPPSAAVGFAPAMVPPLVGDTVATPGVIVSASVAFNLIESKFADHRVVAVEIEQGEILSRQ